jgi:nucleotide-binding universal stress UspA family protein
MKMYGKVLVPLDGSELAECALTHVKNLLKEGSAREMTLLNVVKVDVPWADMYEGVYDSHFDIDAIRVPLVSAAEKYLADVKARLASEGITVKTDWVEAVRPAYAITEYAQKNGMNLIVMATHGYTGMKRMLLGSVASGVLHMSPVPVLLIRPESCRT